MPLTERIPSHHVINQRMFYQSIKIQSQNMMYTSRSNSDMCFVDRDKSLTDIDVKIVDEAVRNRVNRYNRGTLVP